MTKRCVVQLVCCLILLRYAYASASEQLGPVYPIAEPDMLEEIRRTLEAKEKSGELARLQEEATKRSIKSVENPKPVMGLGRVTKARTYYWDPSVIAAKDILDGEGRVIVKEGTRINPLAQINMTKDLLFFDGMDTAQVKLARQVIRSSTRSVKPILTGGRPFDLMRDWQTQVWFDQGGALVRKIGIQATPALVRQEGLRIRIDELPVRVEK